MRGVVLLVMVLSSFAFGKSYTTRRYKNPHGKGLVRTDRSKKFLTQGEYISFLSSAQTLPGNMDLSALVSPPEDQGQCGACWDFSLTKALRSSLMITGSDPGALAFNYLLNNCGPGTKESGCGGGDFDAADNFLNSAGPWLETQDQYTGNQGQCASLPVAGTAVTYQMIGDQNNGPTFKDLVYAVGYLNQALSIDVAAASGDWENYSTGIYDGCQGGAMEIDHMIDLVGYSCETSVDKDGHCVFDSTGNPVNGDGYLLVENNWGEDWGIQAANGHSGYMKTRFKVNGQNCNAIATDALMFTVKTK
jgi:C1A family cysteine protease